MQIDQPKQWLDALQNLLTEQLDIYYQLLDFAQKERTAMSESNLESLNDVTTQKTGLVQILNQLERHRMRLMVDLSKNFKLDPENATLKRLADLTDQPTAGRLLQLRTDLSATMRKLQRENDVNKHLMTHRIKLMDNSINMLNSLGYHDPTYINTGHITRPDDSGAFFSSKI